MKIIFFDDRCSFCRTMTAFFAAHDKKKELYFAPLDGITAKKYNIDFEETMVFLSGNTRWKENIAVFRVFQVLGMPWILLGLPFRFYLGKWVYRFIARYRYMWPHGNKGVKERLLP